MTASASGIYRELVRVCGFSGDQRTVAPFSNSACNLVIESIFTSTSVGKEDERVERHLGRALGLAASFTLLKEL
jgi:hypothetical protein